MIRHRFTVTANPASARRPKYGKAAANTRQLPTLPQLSEPDIQPGHAEHWLLPVPTAGYPSSVELILGQRRPGLHQLGEGADLHLSHDVSAMQFDGHFADLEEVSDLLVELAFGDMLEDLFFARGQ